jgi:CRP-like cAMP-binding protein
MARVTAPACRRSDAASRSQMRMERVASFLLEMDRRLAVTGMMALPMFRRDIGDYLGLTKFFRTAGAFRTRRYEGPHRFT